MQEWMQEVRRSKALAEIVAAASVTDADGNVVETALATDEAEEEAEEEAPAVEIIRPDAE
jgi:trigger factor